MTPNDQIRSMKRAMPKASNVQIAAFMRLHHGASVTPKQVSNALRSRSSRPGPARSPASCPTCGARPCHARKPVTP